MSKPFTSRDVLSVLQLQAANATASGLGDSELAELSRLSGSLRSAAARLRDSYMLHAALGRGVDVLLSAYASALVSLEEEVTCDPSLTTFHVRIRLRDFLIVLPAVAELVTFAESTAGTAGSWVNRLFRATLDGDPVVARASAALLHAVLQPLLASVTHWMAYGELCAEPAGAFFVRSVPLPAPALIPSGGGDDDSGARVQVQLAEAEFEWTDGHVVDWDAVPTELFPPHVARTVLAIGKAVRMLRVQSSEWLAAEPRSASSAAPLLQPTQGGPISEVPDEDVAGSAAGDAVPSLDQRFSSSDSVHIARVLGAVRHAQAVSPLVLECVVDRVRALIYRESTFLACKSDVIHSSTLSLWQGDFGTSCYWTLTLPPVWKGCGATFSSDEGIFTRHCSSV